MSLSSEKYSLFVYDSSDNIIPARNENEFELDHKQEYKLVIYNHDRIKRISATIEIDGKSVGSFRVEADSKICIERPMDKERKFTFYSLGTSEAKLGGLSDSNPFIGSVVVTIEKELIVDHPNYHQPQSALFLAEDAAERWWDDDDEDKVEERRRRLRRSASQRRNKSEAREDEPLIRFDDEDDGWGLPRNDNTRIVTDGCDDRGGGGTALGAASSQRFRIVPKMKTISDERIILVARLVLKPTYPYHQQMYPRIVPL